MTTRFSIVMPVLDRRPLVRAAIESVLAQRGRFDVELIVRDGGSTDGTLDLLRSNTDPRVRWTSGPDGGQADAVNRGLAEATGDIVGWLDADGRYEPGALGVVAEALERAPDAQWVVGRCAIAGDRATRGYRYRASARENFISQMAVFWRRSFGESLGVPDPGRCWAMGYDLWLRMAAVCDPLVLDRVLATNDAALREQPYSGRKKKATASIR